MKQHNSNQSYQKNSFPTNYRNIIFSKQNNDSF
ncbi:formamidopyrimidine-DNA glycosylase [Bacillus cereus]|nr:formamidopyrimidine-DNA glycosylase [Bacillus cereus]MBE7120847.1 formamidopyrimidine-DNA glycosylase [Bacillus cereus]